MEEIVFYVVWRPMSIEHRYCLQVKLNGNVDSLMEISNHDEEMYKSMQT